MEASTTIKISMEELNVLRDCVRVANGYYKEQGKVSAGRDKQQWRKMDLLSAELRQKLGG